MNEEKLQDIKWAIDSILENWADDLEGIPDTMMFTGDPCYVGFQGYDFDLNRVKEEISKKLDELCTKSEEVKKL